jgi:hypothetical protein
MLWVYLSYQHPDKKLGLVVHICNPSTGKDKVHLRPAWNAQDPALKTKQNTTTSHTYVCSYVRKSYHMSGTEVSSGNAMVSKKQMWLCFMI